MTTIQKALAAAAFLAMTSGAAYAAEAAMDCCKGECCCKEKKPAAPAKPDHSQH